MKKNIEIVMLGDSITARADWKNLLHKSIINLGIDGDTTKGVLNRLNRVVSLEPKLVFLMIGINDLCTSIPINEIFNNYIKIIQALRKNSVSIVVEAIILTQMKAVNKKTIQLNKMLEEYCHKNKIDFLDLNPYLCEEQLLKEIYTTDGLHLNNNAYKVWKKELEKIL